MMAVNSLFKKLKLNFDDLKLLIQDLVELNHLKAEYFQVNRDIQIKQVKSDSLQYKLKLSYECATEQQTLLNKKKLEDIESESQKVTMEVQAIEQAMFVIENEHKALQVKLDNIKDESQIITEQIEINKKFEIHQDSMIASSQDKMEYERVRQEELEVQMYEQTVKMATLSEDTDKILYFMEEFIKRQQPQTSTSKTNPIRDNTAFRELSEADRESVNDMLKSVGIQYKEVF